MRGPFHPAGMGVSNNRGAPRLGAPHRLVPVCRGRLLAGVHELDAVALVLERGAIGTPEVLPATGLAIVLLRPLADLLAEVDVAHGPGPSVVRDDERGRADVPGRVCRD